jgi:MFS family permease
VTAVTAKGGLLVDARPTALLPATHLLRISAYWLGLTAIDASVGLVVQDRVQYDPSLHVDPLMTGTATAAVGLAGALISIVVQPTVGYISDFTESRWGRRKPYIVLGSLFDVLFLIGIAYANTLLAIAAFSALLAVSTNVARGPFQGYVPDLVAEPQVGTASALVGMMQVVGNVTGVILATFAIQAHNAPIALVAVAVIELVTMLSVVLRVGRGMPPRPREGRTWPTIARETWSTDILQERSYVWLLTSRLFFLTAGGILFNLAIKYMAEVHGLSEHDAAGTVRNVSIIIVGAIVVVSVPAGRLSDRFGRKPVIYASCGVGMVSMVVAALAPSLPVAYLGALLYGIAGGTFVAVDWALLTDIIPKASAGRYMGISNIATATNGVAAAFVGGLVIDAFSRFGTPDLGPRVAFLLGPIWLAVGALLLRPVDERRREGDGPPGRVTTPASVATSGSTAT